MEKQYFSSKICHFLPLLTYRLKTESVDLKTKFVYLKTEFVFLEKPKNHVDHTKIETIIRVP